jgi:hypothetical protein
MKKIYITEKQLVDFIKLDETIRYSVNRQPGDNIETAIKKAKTELDRDAPNVNDAEFVISKDEVNEDINNSNNVVEEVTNFIITNWGDEFDGSLTISQVKDMIQDAYIEVTGEEIDYNDKNIYRAIQYKLMDYVMNNRMNKKTNESISITKKQIKEAITKKRIAESKVYTKKDFKKMCK